MTGRSAALYDARLHALNGSGCRLPHLWLGDGRSLYSELGPEFTLLRFDQSIEVLPLLMAALGKKVPIKMLDLHFTVAPEPYRHALYLSRPDQHIAWRGDAARAIRRRL